MPVGHYPAELSVPMSLRRSGDDRFGEDHPEHFSIRVYLRGDVGQLGAETLEAFGGPKVIGLFAGEDRDGRVLHQRKATGDGVRSEERRVGKEWRARRAP